MNIRITIPKNLEISGIGSVVGSTIVMGNGQR